jgi:NAD(P)-dependent dehydrogenase (short-subunit alcohol dehydrogenase family)
MVDPSATPVSLHERLSMEGRHVAVTGAASGLGLAICEGLLEFGAHVTMIDRDGEGLERSAAALGGTPGSLTLRRCDIAEPGAIDEAIADSAAAAGAPHAVFANAGIAGGPSVATEGGRLYDLDWTTFEGALAVNLTGTLATVRAAARAMRRERRGSIVVTVSTAGLRGESMVGYGYNASKGAVANLVRQAAIDLAPDGIRVNGIAPGPIKTNIGGAGPIPPDVERAWASTVLLGRMGARHEIQGLALLLASDASSFMTGAMYAVDGGALSGWFRTNQP